MHANKASFRIDRYTRAAQSALTRSNLQPQVPPTPKSLPQGPTHPGSPTYASTTEPTNQTLFSKLPPALASRLKSPTTASVTTDSASLQGHPATSPPASSTLDGGGGPHQRRRSSEITINPSTMSAAPPQPLDNNQMQGHEEPDQGLTRSTSSVTLDGEPRLFPGLVSSRSRRRSGRTSQVEEGAGSRATFRGGVGVGEADVVEEGASGEED